MPKSNITCCYYPTTVVFVDDNESFLDNVLLELDENINTRSFTEPTKAIEYLRQCALVPFADKYLKSLKHDSEVAERFDYSNVEHSYVDVDIFNIHKEVFNPRRFNNVIVVVVDYTMPEMNGLEMCRALKNWPFKFVLITGDATLNNAIEAFNEGLIHQFIPKSSSNFINKIHDIIHSLQETQFEEFSEVIIKNLSACSSASLSDPLLVNFLKNFFKANNIVEYYLINESGCFLMVNARGDLSWMIIKNEEEMLEYTNSAIDNYGNREIIKELQSREKVLFLYTEADHINVTVDDWGKYLYPATKLVGENNTYYYSHIQGVLKSSFFINGITSYESFLTTK